MIKAVVFDLDDTLISEKEYIKSGYNHISTLLSMKLKKNKNYIYDLLLELSKISYGEIFNRLLVKLDISYTKAFILYLVKEYREHTPEIKFFDDVNKCLEKLVNNGVKIGIISDGYLISQKQKLNALGAYQKFDEIVLTEELGRKYWKPNPKSYEIISEKLSVSYEEMLFVGDNPEKDFYISSIYPIKTIRIFRNGIYKNRNYLNNVREMYKAENLFDLFKIIDHIDYFDFLNLKK